ncbi:MAG: tRNA (N(6)-L-threonylcarbamoyladenosine(37)-C(2))-methylthiotransferase MtaB [Pseudomonadota bacterium]
MPSNSKRVAFCTFGCRLNQYDTETMRTLLEEEGEYRTVGMREDADIYVVNTCSVTARADATARKTIRRLAKEHPDARIVVTGCYAQRASQEIAALPGVSVVLGAADRGRIAVELRDAEPGGGRVAVSPVSDATKFLEVPITEMMDRSRAFVKVQEGCNEKCSFCIVPQTRGISRSRDMGKVLDQARELIDGGYPEIVLTGVHVGDYGIDLVGRRLLPELATRLLSLPGLERLRLSSIEPSTVTDELLELMADSARFANHFHIPFQSGSNTVLTRMRRRYQVEDFDRLVNRIQELIPEFGFGTDVICGFPGESDGDFQATFDWLTRWPITYVHPFTYSVRPGSEAESFGDQVQPDIKKRRVRALKRLSSDKAHAFRTAYVGRDVDVLMEASTRAGQPVIGGLTDTYLRVELPDARASLEGMQRVRITNCTDTCLIGTVAGRAL